MKATESFSIEEPVLAEGSIELLTEGKSVTSVIKWCNDSHL